MEVLNELLELDQGLVLADVVLFRLQLDDLVKVVFGAADDTNDCGLLQSLDIRSLMLAVACKDLGEVSGALCIESLVVELSSQDREVVLARGLVFAAAVFLDVLVANCLNRASFELGRPQELLSIRE